MNAQGIESLAQAGRFGDTELIHATKGEVVIPPTILKKNPSLVQAIRAELAKEDTSLDEVTVGSQLASVNPKTGLQEFFIKSLFKKIKKVGSKLVRGAKKVFKKVAPIAGALFIPGVGGALGGALGSVGSAVGSGITSLFPSLSGAVGTIGNLGSSFLGTAENFRNALTSGVGSLFGGGEQEALPAGEQGAESTASTGSFFGRRTPDFIRNIEDKLKEGLGSLSADAEGNPNFNLPLLALAKYYGDATEKALEKESGGMGDIRQSLRPDLALNTYGGIGGFNLGYAEGGEVMDMRNGGESIGPGTGTSDDIPAMLSDGEFVMTAKANLGAGSVGLKKGKGGIMELVPQGEPDRQRGADNMMTLMRYFEARA